MREQSVNISVGKVPFLLLAAIAVILPGQTNLVLAEQSKSDTVLHHFQFPCQTCHSPGESGSDYPDSTNVSGDINQLCTSGPCR